MIVDIETESPARIRDSEVFRDQRLRLCSANRVRIQTLVGSTVKQFSHLGTNPWRAESTCKLINSEIHGLSRRLDCVVLKDRMDGDNQRKRSTFSKGLSSRDQCSVVNLHPNK